MGFRVWGLGFRVELGSGLRAEGLGLRALGLGLVLRVRFRV